MEKGGTNPPYQKNDQSIMILVFDNYILFLIKHKSKNLFYCELQIYYYRDLLTVKTMEFVKLMIVNINFRSIFNEKLCKKRIFKFKNAI